MILKSLSYKKLIDKIIKKSKLLERETFMGDKLARLLVFDVLFGMGVRGKFKSAMKRNQEHLMRALEHYMQKYACTSRDQLLAVFDVLGQVRKPKYMYLNRLNGKRRKEIMQLLAEQGFKLVKYENENDEDEFRQCINEMSPTEFVKDFHVKYLYVFRHDSPFSKENNQALFNDGYLLQIDKVSSFF